MPLHSIKNNALTPHYTDLSSSHKNPLAVVHYRNALPSLFIENKTLHLTVPYTQAEHDEYWYPVNINTEHPAQRIYHLENNRGWCADGENLFAAHLITDGAELAPASRRAYTDLIQLAHTLGYTTIYRIWNYIGRINAPNANGLERYRDFCLGRAQAFEALNYAPSTLPAATGIGFQDGGVTVFLIARKTPQAVNIENALQVPAYQYPQDYGPKSPSFARATLIETQSGMRLYVSGTASIRQHVSLTDSLEQQIAITLENIQNLINTARMESQPPKKYLCESLKIYVRHPQDAFLVSAAFQAAFDISAENAPVFIAEICRSELSLEVEGIFSEAI